MIDFLNELARMGTINGLIFLLLFFYAVREGYNLCLWVKAEVLDKYHLKTQRVENVEERFEQLREINRREDKEIEYLKSQIDEIKKEQERTREADLEYHMAVVRSTLYQIYSKCRKVGYIDQGEYECFEDLKIFYLKNKGNSIFKHKIIPYLDHLEVKGIDLTLNASTGEES